MAGRNFTTEKIRARFGLLTPQEKADQEVVDRANHLFDYFQKARRKTEFEWWMADQFYMGEQYAVFNKSLGQVQRRQINTLDKVVVNKVKQNARFVVAWLNRDHPSFRVLPGVPSADAYVRAKKEEHYCDYLYDKLELNRKNKRTSLAGFKYKIGVQKILWDKDAISPTAPYGQNLSTTTRGEVMIDDVDPFEIYFDPLMQDTESSRGFIHAIPRVLGDVRNNPNYKNREKVTGDQKMASSYIREAELRLQTVGGNVALPDSDSDLATVIVREHFYRKFDQDKKKWVIQKTVTTANGVLLEDREWPLGFYPFEIFFADVQGNPLDGGSVVRDLRSPQKALNQLNSNIQENANVTAKISYRVPRGSNVNVITNEVGQFLEFDPTPGGIPEQMQPANMPAYVNTAADRMEKYIDDLGGNHNASYGRSPGSKASGELVNKLQEGDSNNLALMRDNLDDFQRRVSKKALLTFKSQSPVERMVRTKSTDPSGRYRVISLKPSDVSVDDDIVVTTGTKMPYSMADRQEFLLNMKKEGILTNDQFVKAVNIPDLDVILNTPELDTERALDENDQLLEGKILPTPPYGEDHDTHIQVHTELVKSPEYLKAKRKVQSNIQAHLTAHIQLSYQLRQIANSLNVEPIKRSENVMVRQDLAQFTPSERTQFLSKVGVQSDVAQIQARGGLDVSDPESAEVQAQWEDTQMLDGKPVMISVGDNHKVHIETHMQIMESAAWKSLPVNVQQLFEAHIKQHQSAWQAVMSMPGLVPDANSAQLLMPQVSEPAGSPEPPESVPPNPRASEVIQPKQQTNQAALNPEDATPRPLMRHELLQPKGAVDNQLASEKMQVKQQQAAEKAKAAAAKTKATIAKKPAKK